MVLDLHPVRPWRFLSLAISKRLHKTKASRSHAVSRRGASHDLAAARAISAAASVTPLLPLRPACASKILATCQMMKDEILHPNFKPEKNFTLVKTTFSLDTSGHSMEYVAMRNSWTTLSNAAPP